MWILFDYDGDDIYHHDDDDNDDDDDDDNDDTIHSSLSQLSENVITIQKLWDGITIEEPLK